MDSMIIHTDSATTDMTPDLARQVFLIIREKLACPQCQRVGEWRLMGTSQYFCKSCKKKTGWGLIGGVVNHHPHLRENALANLHVAPLINRKKRPISPQLSPVKKVNSLLTPTPTPKNTQPIPVYSNGDTRSQPKTKEEAREFFANPPPLQEPDFNIIYLQSKPMDTVRYSDFKKILSLLGVDIHKVISIHYCPLNVVQFIVLQEYSGTFIQLMQENHFKLSAYNKFVIKDDLMEEERSLAIKRILNQLEYNLTHAPYKKQYCFIRIFKNLPNKYKKHASPTLMKWTSPPPTTENQPKMPNESEAKIIKPPTIILQSSPAEDNNKLVPEIDCLEDIDSDTSLVLVTETQEKDEFQHY